MAKRCVKVSECAPRVSGDEPILVTWLVSKLKCSPRERG